MSHHVALAWNDQTLASRETHGDLAAEPEPGRQPEVVPAPEAARVIPVRRPAAGPRQAPAAHVPSTCLGGVRLAADHLEVLIRMLDTQGSGGGFRL